MEHDGSGFERGKDSQTGEIDERLLAWAGRIYPEEYVDAWGVRRRRAGPL